MLVAVGSDSNLVIVRRLRARDAAYCSTAPLAFVKLQMTSRIKKTGIKPGSVCRQPSAIHGRQASLCSVSNHCSSSPPQRHCWPAQPASPGKSWFMSPARAAPARAPAAARLFPVPQSPAAAKSVSAATLQASRPLWTMGHPALNLFVSGFHQQLTTNSQQLTPIGSYPIFGQVHLSLRSWCSED